MKLKCGRCGWEYEYPETRCPKCKATTKKVRKPYRKGKSRSEDSEEHLRRLEAITHRQSRS